MASQAAAAAASAGLGTGNGGAKGGMTAKEALAANRAGAAAYADAGGRAGQTRRAEDPTGRRDKAAERRKNRGNRKLSAAAEHAAHAVYDPRALTTEEEAVRSMVMQSVTSATTLQHVFKVLDMNGDGFIARLKLSTEHLITTTKALHCTATAWIAHCR